VGVTRNLGAQLVVVDEGFPQTILDILPSDGDTAVLCLPNIDESGAHRLAPAHVDEFDLAFIQHSAGTTGLQKGVALSHAKVLRQLTHLATGLRIEESDRIYSWLPLYHDMGLIACFMPPMVSHCHVVMQSPTDWVIQPKNMLRLISEYHCTLSWVPNFALQFIGMTKDDRSRSVGGIFSLSRRHSERRAR
jgi:fatty-acyl-CoA synthase